MRQYILAQRHEGVADDGKELWTLSTPISQFDVAKMLYEGRVKENGTSRVQLLVLEQVHVDVSARVVFTDVERRDR
jgi:hypothetical protein